MLSATMSRTTASLADADPLRALFEAARAGDEQAQDALCRALRPRLYRVAYSYVRDADVADDIAQEALIRALTKRFLFLGKAQVGTWATKIAVNLAKNRFRDRTRRGEILAEAGENAHAAHGLAPASPTTAPSLMEGREQSAAIEAALMQLSERQREVARLRLLGELSFADIGKILKMKEANARVTFHQARAKLQSELQAFAPAEDSHD